jgi:hypothetical protein
MAAEAFPHSKPQPNVDKACIVLLQTVHLLPSPQTRPRSLADIVLRNEIKDQRCMQAASTNEEKLSNFPCCP